LPPPERDDLPESAKAGTPDDMTGALAMAKDEEVPSMDGDDEKEPSDEAIVLGKRMEDMVETHDEAAAMCKAEGAEWTLCLIDDLMSGQIYFQETMEEEMTITARRKCRKFPELCSGMMFSRAQKPKMSKFCKKKKWDEQKCRMWCDAAGRTPAQQKQCHDKLGRRRRLGGKLQSPDYEKDRGMDRSLDRDIDLFPESYGVWVHDQCEPFAMEMVDDIIEYEAVGMTAEFNAPNEDSTAAIDSDSMLIGAGIGAVVMLLVVGLFVMIMKWRKSAAKGHESDMSKVVDTPNVVHVEDDSAEVAKVEGTATVAV